MLVSILILSAGFVLLYFGGDFLVKGASSLALRLGLSPLVIGLTVVAFGTSSPELAVSLQAAFSGASDVAIGNVVGSNICNLGLIKKFNGKSVSFGIQLPEKTGNLTVTASATTTTSEPNTANNSASINAALSYYTNSVPLESPPVMVSLPLPPCRSSTSALPIRVSSSPSP